MRLRLFLVVACTLAIAIVIAIVVFGFNVLSGHELDQNPTSYSKSLSNFRPEFIAMVPGSIPASATNVAMKLESFSGMGPSSVRLDVSFRVPIPVAEQILANARKRAITADLAWNVAENEAEVLRGDDYIHVSVDKATGDVVIKLRRN